MTTFDGGSSSLESLVSSSDPLASIVAVWLCRLRDGVWGCLCPGVAAGAAPRVRLSWRLWESDALTIRSCPTRYGAPVHARQAAGRPMSSFERKSGECGFVAPRFVAERSWAWSRVPA